jgi:MFS family permease
VTAELHPTMARDRADRHRVAHLVLINAFVGAMVGIERTVLPLLAEAEFGIASTAAATAFIASFGISKAVTNGFAGALSERWGRRPLLLLGWVIGLPVPVILMLAPSWSWILLANVLLGVNQSLTWSMTVVMKVDLAPPRSWGLVIGWNEFAGYAGMAATAAATGFVAARWGLRPEPFYLGLAAALCGLALSVFASETRPPSRPARSDGPSPEAADPTPTFLAVLARGSGGHAPLTVASIGGLATNLKDGALWGLLPLLLASRAVSVGGLGTVVATYPMVWAVSQLVFGPLSDRIGRRGLITAGLLLQAAGVGGFAFGTSYAAALGAAVTAGLGTGMVYPTFLAFVSHRAEPAWRAAALGVYRLWRDLGYAVGALLSGLAADALGLQPSLTLVAALLTVVAGVFWFGAGRR